MNSSLHLLPCLVRYQAGQSQRELGLALGHKRSETQVAMNQTLAPTGGIPADHAGADMGRAVPDADGRVWLSPGESVVLEMPWSEVCCFMRIAGRAMRVELTTGEYPMAQLYRLDGTPFSFPITLGEAGVYTSADGYYCYQNVK